MSAESKLWRLPRSRAILFIYNARGEPRSFEHFLVLEISSTHRIHQPDEALQLQQLPVRINSRAPSARLMAAKDRGDRRNDTELVSAAEFARSLAMTMSQAATISQPPTSSCPSTPTAIGLQFAKACRKNRMKLSHLKTVRHVLTQARTPALNARTSRHLSYRRQPL